MARPYLHGVDEVLRALPQVVLDVAASTLRVKACPNSREINNVLVVVGWGLGLCGGAVAVEVNQAHGEELWAKTNRTKGVRVGE